jgi:hypothetical protein
LGNTPGLSALIFPDSPTGNVLLSYTAGPAMRNNDRFAYG